MHRAKNQANTLIKQTKLERKTFTMNLSKTSISFGDFRFCKHPYDQTTMKTLHELCFFNDFCMIMSFLSAIKPECTTDPECPDHLACIREKCQNPCFTTTCGVNAECRVTRHRAICYCKQGFEGDPYRICEERKHPISNLDS